METTTRVRLTVSFLVFGLVALLGGARGFAQTTEPSGGELLQSKASMPGYGLESYRIVSEKDEIISVLRNGAVVICKRVASPAAAVADIAGRVECMRGSGWVGG